MRAFIALELPTTFATDLSTLVRQLSTSIEGRFMPPDRRHVTLAFLGEIDQAGVTGATDALDAACKHTEPFVCSSNGLGKFGRASDATLWLGITPEPELLDFVHRLRDELSAREISFDTKKFKPHITLARRAHIPKQELTGLSFPRDDKAHLVTLFKSTLDRSGATYTPLYTVDLAAQTCQA